MVPFLSKDLEALYRNLMYLVLKPDAFDNLSGNDLLHMNLMDKSIYLKRKDVHLGFETGQFLQDLIVKSIVSCQPQVNLDKTAGKLSLIYITEGFREKSFSFAIGQKFNCS